MLLGVKFAGAPSAPVLKACGEYNEVVSLDYYPSESEPLPNTNFFSQVYAAAKKPLLVGEFAYRGNVRSSHTRTTARTHRNAHCDDDGILQDVGLPNTKGAGLVVATQALRAEGYKNFTTILAKLASDSTGSSGSTSPWRAARLTARTATTASSTSTVSPTVCRWSTPMSCACTLTLTWWWRWIWRCVCAR
jgi:hypothetical protein